MTKQCKLNALLKEDCQYSPVPAIEELKLPCTAGNVVVSVPYFTMYQCVSVATKSGYVADDASEDGVVACQTDGSYEYAVVGDYCDMGKRLINSCARDLKNSSGKCACLEGGASCKKGEVCMGGQCLKPVEKMKMYQELTETSYCGQICDVTQACASLYNSGDDSGSICLQFVKTTATLVKDSIYNIDNGQNKGICASGNKFDASKGCICQNGSIGPCTIEASGKKCVTGQQVVNGADGALSCEDTAAVATDFAAYQKKLPEALKAVKCGDKSITESQQQVCIAGKAIPVCSYGFPANTRCFCTVDYDGDDEDITNYTAMILSKGQYCTNMGMYGCKDGEKEQFTVDISQIMQGDMSSLKQKCLRSSSLSAGAITGIVLGCIIGVAIIGACIWYFIFYKGKGKKQQTVEMKTAGQEIQQSGRKDLTHLGPIKSSSDASYVI